MFAKFKLLQTNFQKYLLEIRENKSLQSLLESETKLVSIKTIWDQLWYNVVNCV